MDKNTRFKQMRKCLKMTQADMASMLGISRSSIAGIELGTTGISDAYVKLLERIFNLNPEWLESGEEPMFFEKEHIDEGIPILADIPAGPWEEWIDSYPPGIGEDYLVIPDITGNDLFAVRVDGDSMEPNLLNKDLLIINPHKKFTSGVAVVRHNWGYKVRNVRKLGKDKWLLWPNNPAYDDEIIRPDDESRLYVPVRLVCMREM